MNPDPALSNPPVITTDSVIVTDEWDGKVFHADFRDEKDATITPFSRLNGCMWTLSRERATVFANEDEARRALAARGFANPKKLRFPKALPTGTTPPGL